MNAFYQHHRDSIRWQYRCFDRILLNGLIQPFQQPERVVGFFNTYRRLYPVTRQLLHGIADHFQKWLKGWTENAKVPVVDAPKGRRDEFVDPYFKRAKPDAIVIVLKAREPARVMIAIGDKMADRWHLELSQRWVAQYNVYINDARWGRMFVRMCPYLPFSARVCLNQHHWLANRMREEGIRFQQCANAFLKCAAPKRLQELAIKCPSSFWHSLRWASSRNTLPKCRRMPKQQLLAVLRCEHDMVLALPCRVVQVIRTL